MPNANASAGKWLERLVARLNPEYVAMAERRIRNPEPEPCEAVPEEQLRLL